MKNKETQRQKKQARLQGGCPLNILFFLLGAHLHK